MDSQCCICLEDSMDKKNSDVTKCGHTFHVSCLYKIKNMRCPLCRQDISDMSIFKHHNDLVLEPFVWSQDMYVLPDKRLCLENIYEIYQELQYDLRMATCLKLPKDVHMIRRRRIHSVQMYCAINHGVELK